MSRALERQGVPRASLVGVVAWVVVLLTVALGGQALGRGALAPPALGDPGSWSMWASGRTPLEAAFAVLGLMVVVLAWYLLAATVLVAASRVRGAGRLVSVADVLTLPSVRRAVHALLGVGVVGSSVAGASGLVVADVHRSVRPAAGLELIVAASGEGEAEPAAGAPVMRELPGGLGGASQSGREPAEAGPEAQPADRDPGAIDPDPEAIEEAPTKTLAVNDEWEVAPGDHFWSLAERILAEAATTGAEVSNDDVASYWRLLVDANQDRLADPANPDLIFPGQLVAVPRLPAAPPLGGAS